MDRDNSLIYFSNTAHGSEIQRSPVEVGSYPHYLQGFVHPRWLAGFLPSTVPPIRWEFPTSTGELVVINSEAAKRRKTGIPPDLVGVKKIRLTKIYPVLRGSGYLVRLSKWIVTRVITSVSGLYVP